MRGDAFHQSQAEQAAAIFRGLGCRVAMEYPLQLPDGRLDFVDLFVTCGELEILCEIETSPRYAAVNAEKAVLLNRPLWFIAPNRRVLKSVCARVNKTGLVFDPDEVCFLLMGQIPQALGDCCSRFSAANGPRKNTTPRKSNPYTQQTTP